MTLGVQILKNFLAKSREEIAAEFTPAKFRSYIKFATGDDRAVADMHHMEAVLDKAAQAFRTALTKFRHVDAYIGILRERIMFDVRTSKPGKTPAVLKKGLRAAESGAIAAEWGRYIAGCKMHWKVFEREEREWRAAEDRRMAASKSPKARRWRGIPQSRVIDFWRDRARDRDMPSLAQRARRAWSLLPSAAVVEGVHAVMHARDTPLRSRQLDSTVVGEGILTTNSYIVSHLLSHPAQWRRRVDAAVVVRRQLRAAARHASAILRRRRNSGGSGGRCRGRRCCSRF